MVRVCCSFEGVRSRLRNGVDSATDEVRLANIERSNHDLNLFDSIHRDRITTAWQTVVQSEVVVEVRTIHREVGRTSITAGKTHAVRIRRDTCQILDATVNRRNAVHLLVRDVQRRTGLFRHKPCTFRRNDYLFQLFRRFFQIHIQVVRFTQLQGYVFVNGRLIADVRNCNFIRTTGTHTLQVEAAVHVRDSPIIGSRRLMHCHDGSANDRFSIRRNHAAHAGCRYLCPY